METKKGIKLIRYALSFICPNHNSTLFFIYLVVKHMLEVNRRKKFGQDMYKPFPIVSIPQELLESLVLKELTSIKHNNGHQIVVPAAYFKSLYEENLFFRDEISLWCTVKISTDTKGSPKENLDLSIIKKCIIKEFYNKQSKAGALNMNIKKTHYVKSNNFIEVERIVQIIPSEKLTDNRVCVSNVELFNMNMAVGNLHPRSKNLYLKFLPIKHITLAPCFARKIVIEMVNVTMSVGTDLIDTMLKVYFETPKFLHTGDYFEIPLTIQYTRNFHFKYLNLAKHEKVMYFKCKMVESAENKTKGYFVVRGETEVIQNPNINSLIPHVENLCVPTFNTLFDDVECIDKLIYSNCPFGFEKYLNNFKLAIEPFLLDKKVNPLYNELKCTLQAVFLLRSDSVSGCRLLTRLLARQTGLHFISMSCYQLISSTAKQTESKLDALIQNAKDASPVLVYLEDFEIFAVNAENDEDVRITGSFISKIKDLFEFFDRNPIICIANCSNSAELKPNLSRVFLEEFQIKKLTSNDRLQLLKWFFINEDISICDNKYQLINNKSECLHRKSIEYLSEINSINCSKENENETEESEPSLTDCELCCRKKYYDEILERIVSKTDGLEYGDIDSLIYLVIRDSYLSQIKILNEKESVNNQKANLKLIREEDFDVGIDNLHSLQNKKLAPQKIPKVHWDDIGGLENLKKEIIRTIELPLKFPHLFIKSGLKRSGILLWGPPGCGKTLVARAIASQLNANFLSIKGPELLDMYVGQSEKNMREVFATARSSAPCVIFFDEAEAAAGSRGAAGDSGGAADRLVSQLLAELDGVASTQVDTPNAAVVVVAATNRPDLVEPAMMRPGRIDKLIYVGPYKGLSDKVRVLKASSRSYNLGESVNLDIVGSNLPEKCTGADLASIVNQARHRALVSVVHSAETGSIKPLSLTEKDVVIEQLDFEYAVTNFVPSISDEEMNHYESLQNKFL